VGTRRPFLLEVSLGFALFGLPLDSEAEGREIEEGLGFQRIHRLQELVVHLADPLRTQGYGGKIVFVGGTEVFHLN